MSKTREHLWPRLVLPAILLAIALPNFMRSGAASGEAWPIWRAMLEPVLLVVAGAMLVAAVAAGFVAWRHRRDA